MYVRVFEKACSKAERAYLKTIDWELTLFWAESREAMK